MKGIVINSTRDKAYFLTDTWGFCSGAQLSTNPTHDPVHQSSE
jgi:hypothetical protein